MSSPAPGSGPTRPHWLPPRSRCSRNPPPQTCRSCFATASFAPGPIRKLDTRPGMTGGMWQMRPLSSGYVEAKSADPRQAPAINPRYLSHETDRRAAIGGLRAVRRLFAAPVLAPYLVGEILPGANVQGDDELFHFLGQTGSIQLPAN